MFKAKHTIVHGEKTFPPGSDLTAADVKGLDTDRLKNLGAIEAADLIGETSDPYAGMTAAEKKAAKKAEAEAAKTEADNKPSDDGLDG